MNDLYDETVQSVNSGTDRAKGPVSSEINRLNGLVDELTSAVQSMQRKLEAILGPESESPDVPQEAVIQSSPVTGALRNINSRVIDATQWLNRINSRVEL